MDGAGPYDSRVEFLGNSPDVEVIWREERVIRVAGRGGTAVRFQIAALTGIQAHAPPRAHAVPT
jgi:hypothetical protein